MITIKTRNISKLLGSLAFLLFTACSLVEEFPDYKRGEVLSKNEAIGIFRVINPAFVNKGLLSSLFEQKISVYIDNNSIDKVIHLKSNGGLDDADSSQIVVKRIPAGRYTFSGAYTMEGRYGYSWAIPWGFKVDPGEVFYLGDLVTGNDETDVMLVYNLEAIRRQVRKYYPELNDKLEIKDVYEVEHPRMRFIF